MTRRLMAVVLALGLGLLGRPTCRGEVVLVTSRAEVGPNLLSVVIPNSPNFPEPASFGPTTPLAFTTVGGTSLTIEHLVSADSGPFLSGQQLYLSPTDTPGLQAFLGTAIGQDRVQERIVFDFAQPLSTFGLEIAASNGAIDTNLRVDLTALDAAGNTLASFNLHFSPITIPFAGFRGVRSDQPNVDKLLLDVATTDFSLFSARTRVAFGDVVQQAPAAPVPVSVPEPGTGLLTLLGVIGGGWIRQRGVGGTRTKRGHTSWSRRARAE